MIMIKHLYIAHFLYAYSNIVMIRITATGRQFAFGSSREGAYWRGGAYLFIYLFIYLFFDKHWSMKKHVNNNRNLLTAVTILVIVRIVFACLFQVNVFNVTFR